MTNIKAIVFNCSSFLLCWKKSRRSLNQSAFGWTNIAIGLARLKSLWNIGFQPVERHVKSSVIAICTLFQKSTDTFRVDSHIMRLTRRHRATRKEWGKTERKRKLVCWCKDPVSSAVIFFGGQLVHRKQAGDDKGFVHGSNSHFIKGSCRKLKHDRSNTGLNAFSSFPIFPFQHICLVSALSRLCNGKLLQKHFSVSTGQGVITDVTLKVTSGK